MELGWVQLSGVCVPINSDGGKRPGSWCGEISAAVTRRVRDALASCPLSVTKVMVAFGFLFPLEKEPTCPSALTRPRRGNYR